MGTTATKAMDMIKGRMKRSRKITVGNRLVVVLPENTSGEVEEIDVARLRRELHELREALAVLHEYARRVELQVLAIDLATDEATSDDVRRAADRLSRTGTSLDVHELRDLLKHD